MYKATPYLLLFLSAIIAIFHPFANSSVPFVVIVFLFATAYFYKRTMRKTNVSVTLQPVKNKQVTILLTMNKTSRLAASGTYKITCEHLISGQQQHFENSFQCNKMFDTVTINTSWQHCGLIRIVEANVTFLDPLAWIAYEKNLIADTNAIIWPSYTTRFSSLSSTTYSQLLGHDGGAKERFTPYMPGDAVRDIHWPLSAKMQQLIVQKHAFAETKSEEIALYFNNVETIDQYDAFMDECYSLIQQPEIALVYIWRGSWQREAVETAEQIEALFSYLLQQPLVNLYADYELANCKMVRYERMSA